MFGMLIISTKGHFGEFYTLATSHTAEVTLMFSSNEHSRLWLSYEDVEMLDSSLSNLYVLWTFYKRFGIKFPCDWIVDPTGYRSSDTTIEILWYGLCKLYSRDELLLVNGCEGEQEFDEGYEYGIIFKPKWFKRVWKKDRKRIRKWMKEMNKQVLNGTIQLTSQKDGVYIAVEWPYHVHDDANEFLLLLQKLEKRRKKHEAHH
jgi:hypothetical protein